MNNCIKDQQPQSKSVPIFKSITFPNHMYFRVETIRQNPQLKQSNTNNHSNSKFTTFQTPGINGGNIVNGSVSTKKVNFTSSLSVDPKYPSSSHSEQGIQEDLSKKVIEQVGELISKKKLNFNAIWTTKIPKEELNTPKDFQDQSLNSEVYSIIFNSIAQLSKHINDLFEIVVDKLIDFVLILFVVLIVNICVIQMLLILLYFLFFYSFFRILLQFSNSLPISARIFKDYRQVVLCRFFA